MLAQCPVQSKYEKYRPKKHSSRKFFLRNYNRRLLRFHPSQKYSKQQRQSIIKNLKTNTNINSRLKTLALSSNR